MGLRGPSAVGTPVYDGAFDPDLHAKPIVYNPDEPLLESIQCGQHHPVWMAAQRNYFGGIEILGGILGKRLFLEHLIPIIDKYRAEWFPDIKKVETYCDPPPSQSIRYTNIQIMRDANLRPRWKDNGNAPDVREAVIQSIVGYMNRRLGRAQGFRVNNDPARWRMASHVVDKQSKFFLDGLQSSYVWDEHPVSVGNKKHRQPKANMELVEGAQRCLENLVLNCWAKQKSRAEREADAAKMKAKTPESQARYDPHAWLRT
jgi:hypothetical protein